MTQPPPSSRPAEQRRPDERHHPDEPRRPDERHRPYDRRRPDDRHRPDERRLRDDGRHHPDERRRPDGQRRDDKRHRPDERRRDDDRRGSAAPGGDGVRPSQPLAAAVRAAEADAGDAAPRKRSREAEGGAVEWRHKSGRSRAEDKAEAAAALKRHAKAKWNEVVELRRQTQSFEDDEKARYLAASAAITRQTETTYATLESTRVALRERRATLDELHARLASLQEQRQARRSVSETQRQEFRRLLAEAAEPVST